MSKEQFDKHGEALTLLKEVEDAIFTATGSALLAGEKCHPDDKTKLYKLLCAAGNKCSYVREDLLAPTQPTQALDSELLTAIKNAPTHSYSLAPSARSSIAAIPLDKALAIISDAFNQTEITPKHYAADALEAAARHAPVSATEDTREELLAEIERDLHDLKNMKVVSGEREQARGVAAAEFHVRAMRRADDTGAKP